MSDREVGFSVSLLYGGTVVVPDTVEPGSDDEGEYVEAYVHDHNVPDICSLQQVDVVGINGALPTTLACRCGNTDLMEELSPEDADNYSCPKCGRAITVMFVEVEEDGDVP